MTLPASGQLAMSQIATEFGGAAPHSMSEYRGSGGTPATGAISFADFYGKSAYTAPTVAMPNVNGYKQGSSGTVTGTLQLQASGSYIIDTEGAGGSGTWLTGGSAADVEVLASGSGWTFGTMDQWVSLAASKQWQVSRPTNGTTNATMTLTFRNKNTLAQLDTATVTMEVYRGTAV